MEKRSIKEDSEEPTNGGWTIESVDGTNHEKLIAELDKRWTPEQWENFSENIRPAIREMKFFEVIEGAGMEKTVYIDCRRTGSGAYTTAGGQVVAESGTGNHWTEKVVLKQGEKVSVTDISNSGKHRCYILSIDKDGNEIQEHNETVECEVCSDDL